MRIRIWRAFASNNSGSYTIVGTFRTPVLAQEAAAVLEKIMAEHDAWVHAQTPDGVDGEAPLAAFVRAHGLSTGFYAGEIEEAWPLYGPAPVVEVAERQVLVHAPYTVTMPRALGEFMYRHGGRVDTEIDHGHRPTIVQFYIWGNLTWKQSDEPESPDRLEALWRELSEVVLPPLFIAADEWSPPPITPAWRRGEFHGSSELAVVFPDLPKGVRAVCDLVQRRGFSLRLRVTEAATEKGDLLAHLRGRDEPVHGVWQVILWSVADRIAGARALREATGEGLAETMERLGSLPTVVMAGVSEDEARRVEGQLRAAGADAQALGPDDFIRR